LSSRGEICETPGDTMLRLGGRWTPADRSPGSRAASKLLIHQYLKTDPDTGRPKLKIFDTCNELINELSSLQSDPGGTEDIDRSKKNSQPDHAYDALRYALSGISPIRGQYSNESFGSMGALTGEPAAIDPIFGY